jgi:hypothetical protein
VFSEIETNPHVKPVACGLRSVGEGLYKCWLFDKQGRKKTVQFSTNVQSPLISVNYLRKGDRIVAMGQITVAKDYEDQYDLAYDLYAAEGRLEDWHNGFLVYEEEIRKTPAPVRVNKGDRLNPDWQIQSEDRPELAAELLPAEVLRRRNTKTKAKKFVMPKPAGKATKKASASEQA